nr:MAG TPA: hypothetical protein [Caudoviricetes sp.]
MITRGGASQMVLKRFPPPTWSRCGVGTGISGLRMK